jgi:hypothetical protein
LGARACSRHTVPRLAQPGQLLSVPARLQSRPGLGRSTIEQQVTLCVTPSAWVGVQDNSCRPELPTPSAAVVLTRHVLVHQAQLRLHTACKATAVQSPSRVDTQNHNKDDGLCAKRCRPGSHTCMRSKRQLRDSAADRQARQQQAAAAAATAVAAAAPRPPML